MQKKMKNIDIMDLFQQKNKQQDRYTSRAAINIHEFYLCGNIESADEYIEWFDVIRHAGPNDVIRIIINSYGGDLFTAIQFLRVIGETDATIIVSVEGACMSAATMIFLSADQFEVSEHSMFMFHNYSGGVMGKGGEMLDQLQHERIWSEKLLRNIYQDFLNEEEIGSMLNNRDLWMDGEEVVKRLEGKKAAMEAKQATEDADGITEVEPEEMLITSLKKAASKKKLQNPEETE
jgi:ATP-dependent protease ClpP protease subunit